MEKRPVVTCVVLLFEAMPGLCRFLRVTHISQYSIPMNTQATTYHVCKGGLVSFSSSGFTPLTLFVYAFPACLPHGITSLHTQHCVTMLALQCQCCSNAFARRRH